MSIAAPPVLASVDLLSYEKACDFLNALLKQKQCKNKRYSSRSFAKFLTLPTSTTNAILTGRRKISSSQATLISQKIGLEPVEQLYFRLLVDREAAVENGMLSVEETLKTRLTEAAWLVRASRREGLKVSLPFTPEWQHLVLYVRAGMNTETSPEELREFGRNIGLSLQQIDLAIEDLTAQGHLVLNSNRSYVATPERILLTTEVSNLIYRKIHEAMSLRATEAIRQQDPTERYSATEFVTLDEAGFKQLRELTQRYLDQLQFEGERPVDGKKVYCISLHAFQLSHTGAPK